MKLFKRGISLILLSGLSAHEREREYRQAIADGVPPLTQRPDALTCARYHSGGGACGIAQPLDDHRQ